jgi:hypothetical protein
MGTTVSEPNEDEPISVITIDPVVTGDTATLDETEVNDSITDALKAIKDSDVGVASILIDVINTEDVTKLEVPMSANTLKAIAQAAADETVAALSIASNDVGAVLMDGDALVAILTALNEDPSNPTTVTIVLDSNSSKAASFPADSAAEKLINDQNDQESPVQNVQVFDISVLIGSNEVPIDGGYQAFYIVLPYTAAQGNTVTVNYIDESTGNITTIYPSYGDDTVSFYTSHLSLYAVVESTPPSSTYSPGGGGGGSAPIVPEEEEEPKAEEPADGGSAGSWADNPFSDVRAADWFYADVEYAVKNGLFEGTSASTFSPNTSMTRGMIVTVLGRLYDADVSAYTDSGFNDVAAGQYYTGYVEWAKDNGIVNGVGDNMFAPNTPVSRQDFAVLLMRYAEFAQKQFPTTRQFSVFADDADIADYARNAIQTLYNGGIINGVGDNTIEPNGSATRAQVAAMLHRFIEAAQ